MRDKLTETEQLEAENDLVVRARTDAAAFGQLYDRYYPRVAQYCMRRLYERAAAEDVTSEVFLQVATHLRTFSGRTETDFRCWLFRIATNSLNAYLRQASRRQALWRAAVQSRQISCLGDSQAPPEHDALDWPLVYQAIQELDDREQTIVMLRFFGECSHDEIASVLKINSGAVRTALSRTLTHLREKFADAIPSASTLGASPQE